MQDPTISDVEITIEDAQKLVDRRDSLRRLQKNKDFKALIVDGYLRDEAIRLTSLLGSVVGAKFRDETHLELIAIGKLDEYFRAVTARGNQAAESIEEHRQLAVELAEEGQPV